MSWDEDEGSNAARMHHIDSLYDSIYSVRDKLESEFQEIKPIVQKNNIDITDVKDTILSVLQAAQVNLPKEPPFSEAKDFIVKLLKERIDLSGKLEKLTTTIEKLVTDNQQLIAKITTLEGNYNSLNSNYIALKEDLENNYQKVSGADAKDL